MPPKKRPQLTELFLRHTDDPRLTGSVACNNQTFVWKKTQFGDPGMNEKTTLHPNETGSVQEYLKGVMPLLMGAGGKPVRRLKVNEVFHGKPGGMVLVMDFDSADAISSMFASDDYAALVPVRDKGFSEMNIQLTQEM
jgi:uncharacterized protein (DUF1330 family)